MPQSCRGRRKLPPTPLISTFCTARSATLTRYCSRRSSRESTQAGNFTSAGDVRWQRGCGSPSRGRRTPEQIPSASPALPQQLPPIAEEGESTAGEGASEEGASNQGGRRVQGLNSEFSLGNAAEVWPPVLPATREAPAAELGAGVAGVQKATPQHYRPPPGRGGASGRIRSRGSGGAEGNTPTQSASPAAELGAGAAGVWKATPRHHRPPPGREAPAAELGAGAAGVRKATPRHHRPPPGGEAPAAE